MAWFLFVHEFGRISALSFPDNRRTSAKMYKNYLPPLFGSQGIQFKGQFFGGWVQCVWVIKLCGHRLVFFFLQRGKVVAMCPLAILCEDNLKPYTTCQTDLMSWHRFPVSGNLDLWTNQAKKNRSATRIEYLEETFHQPYDHIPIKRSGIINNQTRVEWYLCDIFGRDVFFGIT